MSCRNGLRDLVTFALNTGCRKSEILSLTWQHVDLKHGFIRIADSKNGETRDIAINLTLAEMFKSIVRRISLEHEEINDIPETATPRTGAITPAMIEQARRFPIDRLIEFDRQGKALAWCHGDRAPSLSWYRAGNRATCWPCGRTFNSIDTLIQRDGMSFVDAVKSLTH